MNFEYRASGELIACHKNTDDNYTILVYWPECKAPWVVGAVYRSGESQWTHGEYFTSYEEALEEFKSRFERNKVIY